MPGFPQHYCNAHPPSETETENEDRLHLRGGRIHPDPNEGLPPEEEENQEQPTISIVEGHLVMSLGGLTLERRGPGSPRNLVVLFEEVENGAADHDWHSFMASMEDFFLEPSGESGAPGSLLELFASFGFRGEEDEEDEVEDAREELTPPRSFAAEIFASPAEVQEDEDDSEDEVYLRGGFLHPDPNEGLLPEENEEEEDHELLIGEGQFVMSLEELTLEPGGPGAPRNLAELFALSFEEDEAEFEDAQEEEVTQPSSQARPSIPGSFPGAEDAEPSDQESHPEPSPKPESRPPSPPSPSIPGEFTTISTEVGDEHLRALEEGTVGGEASVPLSQNCERSRGTPVWFANRRRRQHEDCPPGCFGCEVCEGSELDFEAGEEKE